MSASTSFRAAVVQAASVGFDREETLAKAERLTREAAGQGAQLVVFPEAFVSGYPRGSASAPSSARAPTRAARGFRRYWDSASTCPARPSTARAIARGAAASTSSSASSSATAARSTARSLFFAADGAYLGKHRKLMPTASERLVWGFGDGSTLPVFDTPLGKLGAVICWENYMPLLRTAMYAKGIEIYCAPTADARDTWLATMRHIACEGRCFVLSANQFARRRDYPADYPLPGNDPDAVICAAAAASSARSARCSPAR